jgi:uncharacterized membrane protein YraQ (UPF0718 family)
MLDRILNQLLDLSLEMGPLLLFGLAVAGVLHVMVSEEMVLRHLGGRGWRSVLKATAFGIPLPLCSCSVVPVAASLRRKGAGDGAAVSFLIGAPQIGADSFLLTQGLLGPFFALFRVVASLATALVAGLLVDAVRKDVPAAEAGPRSAAARGPVLREFAAHVMELVGSLANNLILGLVLAALILALLPDGALAAWQGDNPWLSMVAALLVGLPLYVCATASTPIAAALVLKGLHPGAALVFLLAGPATNLVTLVLLRGSLGVRSLGIYLGTIAVMALLAGWILGVLRPDLSVHLAQQLAHRHECGPGWLEWTGGVGMGLLLLAHYLRRWLGPRPAAPVGSATGAGDWTVEVEGMTCEHCAGRVQTAVGRAGLGEVLWVDAAAGRLCLRPDPARPSPEVRTRLAACLEEAGYALRGDSPTS